MKVGILGALDTPLLGHIMRVLVERGIAVDAVILDAAGLGPRSGEIHAERTGGRLPPIPISEFAAEAIPCYFVEHYRSDVAANLAKKLGLDLLVNAGTARILKGSILNASRIGILGIHPGMIPNYRGCTNVEWAIFNDEPVGNSIFFVNEAIDRGPVVLQEEVVFPKNATYEDIRVAVHLASFDLLARAIKRIEAEGLSPANLPIPEEGRYFRVIGDAEMAVVKSRLAQGAYSGQRL